MNHQQALWEGAVEALAPPSARYLVVRLPAFRLERCGYGADELVGLVAERRSATRLVACTPAAREAGLREDMTVAEARVLVAGVELEPLDEAGEAADRAELVRALEQVCDRVRPLTDDELVLELSACAPLYGGEQGALARVRAFVEGLGHTCLLVVSDHPLASAAIARCLEGGAHAHLHGAVRPPESPAQGMGAHPRHMPTAPLPQRREAPPPPLRGDVIVPRGEGARALERLPVRALGPSEELVVALRVIGVRTVGAFAALDAASVAGRFGEEGARLHRVARGVPGPPWVDLPLPSALGRLHLQVEHELATVEELMARVGPGLETLRAHLETRAEVVAQLELRLDVDGANPVRVRVRVGRPTRDPALLAALVRTQLERLRLEAPVVGLTLHAPEIAPEAPGQEELFSRREATESLPELVARLSDALGPGAVARAERVETWRPERAWAPVDPLAPRARGRPVVDDPVALQEGDAWCAPLPRPTQLRRAPRPLRVREEGGRPIAVCTPRGWLPVTRAEGPERLEGDWWERDGGYARDYWVVEVSEGTWWLARERDAWFLWGWF